LPILCKKRREGSICGKKKYQPKFVCKSLWIANLGNGLGRCPNLWALEPNEEEIIADKITGRSRVSMTGEGNLAKAPNHQEITVSKIPRVKN